MRVEYSPTARRNLAQIGESYFEFGGILLARRMIGQIKEEIGILADFPESAPSYEMAPGIRRLVVANGTHLVFYRVTSNVQVLHIRRGERASATVEDIGKNK